MEFRVLGPIEVLDGTRQVALPAGRGRALLALLVLHAGETVLAERLIDELWGERPPATASTVVQGLVSRLRKELEPARGKGEEAVVLQTVGNGYRLAVDRDSVDAHHFRHLVEAADGAMPRVRSALLAEALALWRGPALADFVYEPFAQRPISTLDEIHLLAVEDRIENDLELGKEQELVPELERIIAEHPYRERLRGLLMVALYRGGRQAEALNAYQATRRDLQDELGIEPMPALSELQAAILRHDPSLELAGLRRTSEPSTATLDGWLPRERRTITVVSVDLAPKVNEDADLEALGRIANRCRAIANEVLSRNGARVEHVVGDLVMGLFGFPIAHEDDAVRAVRAALELRSRVAALEVEELTGKVEFSMRAGIDTGDIVVAGSGGSLREMVAGTAVTSAYRLQLAADSGDVVVGAGTQRHVRGVVVLQPVSDRASASGTWRVLDVVSDTTGAVRSLEGAMIGRQAELTRLRAAFRRAVRSESVVRCLVLGEAGIGKSRLVWEFVDSVGGEAEMLTGRCAAYGADPAFAPLRQIVLDAAGPSGWPSLAKLLTTDDATQIAAAVGIARGAGSVHALFPAVGRLLEALAVGSPLIVVLEDLHWAEPSLLDLVDYIERAGKGRIMLLCVARPDLVERRHEWEDDDLMLLDPLPPRDMEELVVDRAGPMTPGVVQHIVTSAQGNPLYAEQLLAARADLAPDLGAASLRALLTSRLDRVGPGERDLLRCASVIGEECDRDVLAALLPDEATPFVDRHIEALETKQLVARIGAGRFRFSHVLIRAAAYQSMTREDRARLHESYASWFESDPTGLAIESDEIVGYHLEQAIQQRRAAGGAEGASSNLALRAGEHLARAADGAIERFDQAAAENLMSRARALLPLEHPKHHPLTQRLAEVDLILGHFTRAQEMLRELVADAIAVGDEMAERAARLEHARIQFVVGPDPVALAAIRREAEQAVDFYTRTEHQAGLARAHFLTGCIHLRTGLATAAEASFRDSMALADRWGDVRDRVGCRWMIAEALVAGPKPVAACFQQLDELSMNSALEHPGVLVYRAVLSAMEARFDVARQMLEQARHVVLDEMRARRMLMFVAQGLATVALLAGDLQAAERELRTRLAFARETGEAEHLAPTAARLAFLVRARGRGGEADELAALSSRTAPAEGVEAQALSKAAMAQANVDERLAAEAVELARADQLPGLRADLLLVLADIRHASGREGSDGATDEAARLYRLKGNLAAAKRLAKP